MIDMNYISIMDIRHLRYFVAVAEELHFGRAAEREHVSQPPLSQQIKALEDELDVQLFIRTSRKVCLTEAGKALLQEAKGILESVERAVRVAKLTASGHQGHISIGFVGPAMEGPLPVIIQEFRSMRPKIVVEMQEMSTVQQLEALRAERLDIGFVRLFNHDLSDLIVHTYMREPYILAVPEGHLFETMSEVRLKDLKGVPLIFFPRHMQPNLHDTIVQALNDEGVEPYIIQEVLTKNSIVALVATGMGVGLVPASMQSIRRAGVSYHTILGRLPEVELSAVCRKQNVKPQLHTFLETVLRFTTIGPTFSQ